MNNWNFGKQLAVGAISLGIVGALSWGAFCADIQPSGSVSGKINHTALHKGESGSCSLTALPKNVEEFKKLQEQVAVEPQGAVAMFLAAMNIYSQDEKAGRECLELASHQLGGSEISILKDKLRGPESDSYRQKYLPMAFFKGATPENKYTPDKPYTVEVSVNNGRPYSVLTSAHAPVIYLNVKTRGTDIGSRSVSVIKPEGSNYYVVFERGGLMMQVKGI
ncbi:hypothetical protein IJT93_13060 [bacterium]|nr:hypothetical protein [bacterium]